MNLKRIVITGGPGTGKTSIIDALKQKGYTCFDEVSRQVTLEARKKGVEQLFLTEPLLFSEMLMDGRLKQFHEANAYDQPVFLDRGIPDVLAYMDFFGTDYPEEFITTCESHRYDQVFVLAPWQEIFKKDAVRYESFQEAERIHGHLLTTYKSFGYDLLDVPFESVEKRTEFILDALHL